MAVGPGGNSLFNIVMFHKGLIVDYAASYRTAMYATPYAGFDGNTASLGKSITEKYPFQYNGVYGLNYNPATQVNASIDKTMTMTLGATNYSGTQFSCVLPFSLTAEQITYFSFCKTPADFRKYFIVQLAKRAASMMDQALIDKCIETWADVIGDPALPVNGFDSLSIMNAQLARMEIQMLNSDVMAGFSPTAYNQLQTAYPNYFNEAVNLPILRNGQIKSGAGLNIYSDNLMRRHTNGSFATSGTIQVNATVPNQGENTPYVDITLKGFTPNAPGVLRYGDYITFGLPGNYVQSVTPREKLATGRAKTFIVYGAPLTPTTTNPVVNADSNGECTVRIHYAPIFDDGSPMPNPYVNVTRQIIENDVVNLVGGANATFSVNLVFPRVGLYFCNPFIATYPAISTGGKQYSTFAYEKVESLTVPGTDGMSLNLNLAGAGDLSVFSAVWALRSICGGMPLDNMGFVFLSKE